MSDEDTRDVERRWRATRDPTLAQAYLYTGSLADRKGHFEEATRWFGIAPTTLERPDVAVALQIGREEPELFRKVI